MVKEKYKNLLINIIKKHISTCKIYLFGSRASKKHTPYSDIDIAIDIGKQIDIGLLGKIKDEIEESIIPFFVDIVDLNNVPKELNQQILKYGGLWKL